MGESITRLMTKPHLRGYLDNMPWAEIADRMRSGRLPGPLWGLDANDKNARWDRRSVDRALDAASDIPASIQQQEAFLDRQLGIR